MENEISVDSVSPLDRMGSSIGNHNSQVNPEKDFPIKLCPKCIKGAIGGNKFPVFGGNQAEDR